MGIEVQKKFDKDFVSVGIFLFIWKTIWKPSWKTELFLISNLNLNP